ncbi:hypothetical protein G7B40_036155 [Aetokthonos hydrillicola Thurmond2011]|jgi:hypothetical protein|uniref:Isopropylmalate/homocitrate/citramalate synthases n=1 Tax=Aetokthonos hydrillicola Thurmond2011 TaxID=2712845 RepID=A0AAP5IE40_9CYAN|nr:hypothetical protein [Aetokthonos hydrillicola]MBO3457892.1 hypothetical protein [Aetokthonos hydrillicola CCALA 1050]MBW4587379.1 hypothetical protein [Aetokthonos hydrillicola CCALA 1050]MDR9899948.1 hypothetical protein [Aetokthonos hydrillicola Thurmond2011]
MEQHNKVDKEKFLYPRSRYHGRVKPENLLFNANLQEFAHKISYIAALETSGKISPEEAYTQTRTLWKQLKHSSKEMGIGSTKDSPQTNS